MTEPRKILAFVPFGNHHAAFLGVHLVGSVRDRPGGGAEWISYLGVPLAQMRWHPARDIDVAKDALIEHATDWYEAAHQPLAEGQGERIARQLREVP